MEDSVIPSVVSVGALKNQDGEGFDVKNRDGEGVDVINRHHLVWTSR